jgi:membrane-associated phospholipid phosphatase
MRARGRMSRMSWRAVPGPERLVLLSAPGRDAVLLKGIYGRARPPDSLVVTTGTSFPSGHAVAASATVVAAVIALAPPGRRRAWWALAAMAFSILMGLSRAYLGAHWLSDAVAGILLGTSCAVATALIVGQLQRHAEGRQRPA